MGHLKKSIEIAGGASQLARLLGVTPQAVCNWRHRPIPITQALAIERITRGEVKADELRPDLNRRLG